MKNTAMTVLISILCVLFGATALATGAQKQDEAERLLKKAKDTEQVDGNCAGAIPQYQKVVDTGNLPKRSSVWPAVMTHSVTMKRKSCMSA
jgi:hypothetical protein